MLRLVLLALALTACTDDPATDVEIHEVTQCDDNWSGHYGITQYESCEAPCADLQQLGSRSSCTYQNAGMTEECAPGQFSDWNGRTGCCVVGASNAVTFAVCE
jgi:hypothetical protein